MPCDTLGLERTTTQRQDKIPQPKPQGRDDPKQEEGSGSRRRVTETKTLPSMPRGCPINQHFKLISVFDVSQTDPK
jgi:hypothetical protein